MNRFLIMFLIAVVFAGCENSKQTILKNDNFNDLTDTDQSESDELTNDDENDIEATDEKNDTEKNDADIKETDEDEAVPDEEIPDLPVEYESGFIELESVDYKLDNQAQTSDRVRMWYNFQPADESPNEKPLFVFFNGGPGSATMLLFSYNTSKMTADQAFADDGITENVHNWNKIGNLLYIDARQTGFSYGLTENPSNQSERSGYFRTKNFNVFVDAADFIRVVLRFLKMHPDIQANKVVLTGESYGGTRATAMLNILLNVREYAAGNRNYYDESLFNEIDAHFMEINPEMSALPHKEAIKQQFFGQVLVQPLIAGDTQFAESGRLLEIPGSPIYEVENETGVDYKPCANTFCQPHNNALQYLQKAGRDMYAYRKPYNWLFDYTDPGAQKMVEMELFEKLIKNDPRKIEGLYAGNRSKAFRFPDNGILKGMEFSDMSRIPDSVRTEIEYREAGMKVMASGDLEQVFGVLQSWDDYYIDLNQNVTQIFYYASTTPYSAVNGQMFLENIRDVKTFITAAEEDIIIYAPGIPESLKKFSEVSDVDVVTDKFTVKYKDSAEVEVTFPFYPGSSHSVSVNQPEKFLNDVTVWLNF